MNGSPTMHTYICTDTYMYTYVPAKLTVHTYTCTHTYIQTYIHIYRPSMFGALATNSSPTMHTYICTHTYIHSYIHTYIRTHAFIEDGCTPTYAHTRIHTHTQTYIHTYKYTCTNLRRFFFEQSKMDHLPNMYVCVQM